MNVTHNKKHYLFLLFLFTTCYLSSCIGTRPTTFQAHLIASNCNQEGSYSTQEIPKPIHELDIDTALLARFSFRSLNVANAIGIVDELTQLVHNQKAYKQSPSLEKKMELLELSQKINQQINVSSLEVSAVASEIDCEEERTDQIANYLASKENNTETRLTVGAITIGATGAIATGAMLNNGNTGDYIGVATGIAEAAFGLLILINKRKIDFYHPRNVLREVWEGKDTSEILPASVWYYLNYFNPEKSGTHSLRYQIIERWMSFGQISESNSKERKQLIEIYFGDGGRYTAEQLDNRANMLDQLEAHITLMKQDLKVLANELAKLE